MVKNQLFIPIFLLLLNSCAVFKTVKLGPVNSAKEGICLNAEGRGRFIFDGQKHIFSYQSHFNEDEMKWETIIDFPVYGRESIQMEWDLNRSRAVYDASYEQALLKNSNNLNPSLLDGAKEMWTEFFEDMLYTRGKLSKDSGQNIEWKIDGKQLEGKFSARGFPAKVAFLNPDTNGQFGRFDFQLNSKEGKKLFGMELLVRNCLEKTE